MAAGVGHGAISALMKDYFSLGGIAKGAAGPGVA
jgi:hypothetical protein